MKIFAVGARKADKTLVKRKSIRLSKKLYQEGKFKEISNKWFGDDGTDAVKNKLKRVLVVILKLF